MFGGAGSCSETNRLESALLCPITAILDSSEKFKNSPFIRDKTEAEISAGSLKGVFSFDNIFACLLSFIR